MRTTSIITAAVAALVLSGLAAQPALSAGPLECKGAVFGLGPIDDDAISSWQAAARQAYGPGWDNFDLARGKQWGQLNLALAVEQTVSASPCRPAKFAQINSNLGGLTMQPVQPNPTGQQPVTSKKFTKLGQFGKFGG